MADVAPSLLPRSRPARPAGARRHTAWKWSRRLLAVGIAVFATTVISFFTIDLGRFDGLRQAAERRGSAYLERPLRIGKLSIRPGRGQYVLQDVVIDGVAGGRPFFSAKTITVRMGLSTIWQRQILFEVHVDGWEMLVERWSHPDRHNIPRLTRRSEPSGRKAPFSVRTTSRADRGTFTFEDHGAPWSVVAPNLSFAMDWSVVEKKYVGRTAFTGGTVRILDALPMRTDMTTRFQLEGTAVTLPHLDLKTDGADTHVTGRLDFSKWPESSYTVRSTLDFKRMREIFFAKEDWQVVGTGRFAGVFNLYKDRVPSRDLVGEFSSDLVSVGDVRFPNLHGSLVWLPDRFAVTHADADFFGGRTRFAYAIEPLGTPTGSTQKFIADYERVDLADVGRYFDVKDLELVGRARGRVGLAWPSGRLGTGLAGTGETTVVPPEGVVLAGAALPAALALAPVGAAPDAAGLASFNPTQPLGPLPVGGTLSYRFDPEGITFGDSTVATPTTFIALKGRRARDGQARFPFDVVSRDWQASARLLAAIMTAAGKPSGAVEVGGAGTFNGVMTETFDNPRIEGRFAGDDVSAWRVVWGRGEGHVVIQNRYLDLTDGIVTRGPGTIRANGRFSLGFPRQDKGEEIRATIGVQGWPLNDLRVAFRQEGWPIDGTIGAALLELRGKYADNGLYGDGPLRIDQGVAWDETFETANGLLEFKGATVEVNDIRLTKGTGQLTGSATMGWDGSYEFNAKGERIAVESLDTFKLPREPLTGVLAVTCGGKATFAAPAYRCQVTVPDMAAGNQGIGLVQADLAVNRETLTIASLTAKSNRLTVASHGTIEMNDRYDAVLDGTFTDSLLDPYIKLLSPDWSELNRVVIDGSARIRGPLKDPSRVRVEATITKGTLSLFNYELHNDGPIGFTIDNQALAIGQFKLAGKDTAVTLTGGVSMAESTADLTARGTANLAILDRLNVTSSGTASLEATVKGPFDKLSLGGSATIAKGQFRYGTLPSLTDISGTLRFDDRGVNADDLRAKMGGGDVTFLGNVTLNMKERRFVAYQLGASGQRMRLRYPEGFVSVVDADLGLSGPIEDALLDGVVNVRSADYIKRVDTDAATVLALAAASGAEGSQVSGQVGDKYKLTYNVSISADTGTLRIDNGAGTHIAGSGNLVYQGPADRPSLMGRIEIDRGQVAWNGNRFDIQSGSSIDFRNPVRIEPEFEVTATTRPRAPDQVYDVNVRMVGTASKLDLTLNSDPWLSKADIVMLLLGQPPDGKQAEQRALRSSGSAGSLFESAGMQLLAAPISSGVGSVVGQIPGAPTVTIAPILGTELTSTATARVIVGKQISTKAYLTYARTLTGAENELILLEYEQSERLSWILSRNADRTFALDFRIRNR